MARAVDPVGAPGRLAVVGGGWAGLAAAVRGCQAGFEVTQFEMARHWGGRARSDPSGRHALDNGQHILIGAYARTLDLMQTVGIDPGAALLRLPLVLEFPDGRGLRLQSGPPMWSFLQAALRFEGWRWIDRLSLLRHATAWMLAGFRCADSTTVAQLCRHMTRPVVDDLIAPLCVAALNTPAPDASAQVLLRVLHDALFSGPGGSDLLLPRWPLSQLLPVAAMQWLERAGATGRPGHRVQNLVSDGHQGRWRVDDEPFDAVVLATSAAEAARLTSTVQPVWSECTSRLGYEPIITVYLQAQGVRLAAPMLALKESSRAPAQFVLDHGAIGGQPGRFAFVVSGASKWVECGLEATAAAVLAQAQSAFAPGTWPADLQVETVRAEKRATFRCTPGLQRPAALIAQGLVAAGDYVAGPYPATLEGAVRSGEQAIAALGRSALPSR